MRGECHHWSTCRSVSLGSRLPVPGREPSPLTPLPRGRFLHPAPSGSCDSASRCPCPFLSGSCLLSQLTRQSVFLSPVESISGRKATRSQAPGLLVSLCVHTVSCASPSQRTRHAGLQSRSSSAALSLPLVRPCSVRGTCSILYIWTEE